jgi:hypothetical protein
VAVAGDGRERFSEERETFGRGMLLGLAALAHLDLEAGRTVEALVAARRRAAVARDLLATTPQSEHFLSDVVGAVGQACACLMDLGRLEGAEAEVAEAVALAARAVAEAPAVAGRTRVLVEALVAQAALQATSGHQDELLATQRRILEVLAPWIGDREPGRETPADFLAAAERARREIASRSAVEGSRAVE